MTDPLPSEPTEGGGSCETCFFYLAAKAEIASHKDANRVTEERAGRVEDKTIPWRRSRALGDLATDLELQQFTCAAKGGPSGCQVALYCIARHIEQKQIDSLRHRP